MEHVQIGLAEFLNQPESGIGNKRRTGIGRQCDSGSPGYGGKKTLSLTGTASIVVTNQFPALEGNAVNGQQMPDPPRILGGEYVRFFEDV